MISVIIPIYNAEKTLKKCMDSICCQLLTDMEVICVDDGSTDNSSKIIQEYVDKDSRIKKITKKNGGLVSARKAGLNVANGDYIAWVDADDWIEDGMFSDLYAIAEQYHPDVISTGVIRDYCGKCVIDQCKLQEGLYQGDKLTEVVKCNLVDTNKFMRYNITPHIWNKWIKTSLIKKYYCNLPDETNIDEDVASVYPCFLAADSVYLQHKAYYHYVSNSDSMMHTIKEKEYERLCSTYSYLEKVFCGFSETVSLAMKQYEFLKTYAFLFVNAEKLLSYDGNNLKLFGEVKPNSKIVVYGMGAFSKSFISFIRKKTNLNIVALADARGDGNTILNLETLDSVEFDYIVISVLLADVIEKIVDDLVQHGVSESKILYIYK